MTTARALVKSVLRKIQVLGVGSSLSAEEAVDTLSAINSMLASWSADGLSVYADTKETFSLTAGKTVYTIGSGQDFDTEIPKEILAATVRDNDLDYPLSPSGVSDYAYIADKDVQATPSRYYFDGGYPIGKIHLWPSPSSATQISLYSRKALSAFSSLDAVLTLPGEYERAIIYNAAVEVAPEYEKEPSPTVYRIARQSKSIIANKATSSDMNVSRVDDALIGRGEFDIYSGTYR